MDITVFVQGPDRYIATSAVISSYDNYDSFFSLVAMIVLVTVIYMVHNSGRDQKPPNLHSARVGFES